jgi:hypothetical protein
LARVLARCKLLRLEKRFVEVAAMSTFQKIAVGLLGLTNPEMFIPISRPTETSTPKIEFSGDQSSTEPVGPRAGRGVRAMRALRFMVVALAVGSRTVALADNSQLRRELGARARGLYGSDED